jgi:hypothetical protein
MVLPTVWSRVKLNWRNRPAGGLPTSFREFSCLKLFNAWIPNPVESAIFDN